MAELTIEQKKEKLRLQIAIAETEALGLETPREPQNLLQTIGGGIRAAGQGSVPYYDEITAGARSVIDPSTYGDGRGIGERFDLALDQERGGLQQFREENPKTAFGIEVAAGFNPYNPINKIPGANRGPGFVPGLKDFGENVSRNAVEGAIFGQGEGDTLDTRMENAGIGAAWSAALTGGMDASGRAVNWGLDNFQLPNQLRTDIPVPDVDGMPQANIRGQQDPLHMANPQSIRGKAYKNFIGRMFGSEDLIRQQQPMVLRSAGNVQAADALQADELGRADRFYDVHAGNDINQKQRTQTGLAETRKKAELAAAAEARVIEDARIEAERTSADVANTQARVTEEARLEADRATADAAAAQARMAQDADISQQATDQKLQIEDDVAARNTATVESMDAKRAEFIVDKARKALPSNATDELRLAAEAAHTDPIAFNKALNKFYSTDGFNSVKLNADGTPRVFEVEPGIEARIRREANANPELKEELEKTLGKMEDWDWFQGDTVPGGVMMEIRNIFARKANAPKPSMTGKANRTVAKVVDDSIIRQLGDDADAYLADLTAYGNKVPFNNATQKATTRKQGNWDENDWLSGSNQYKLNVGEAPGQQGAYDLQIERAAALDESPVVPLRAVDDQAKLDTAQAKNQAEVVTSQNRVEADRGLAQTRAQAEATAAENQVNADRGLAQTRAQADEASAAAAAQTTEARANAALEAATDRQTLGLEKTRAVEETKQRHAEASAPVREEASRVQGAAITSDQSPFATALGGATIPFVRGPGPSMSVGARAAKGLVLEDVQRFIAGQGDKTRLLADLLRSGRTEYVTRAVSRNAARIAAQEEEEYK